MNEAFFQATEQGDIKLAQQLLNDNQVDDINATDEYGYTALFGATLNSHLAIVELLVKQKGIDLDYTREGSNMTALSWALDDYHKDIHDDDTLSIVQLLLKHGAKKNLDAVLIWAAARGYDSVLNQVLEHKHVNIHTTDRLGNTALFQAARKGNIPCIKILLKAGADLQFTNKYQTPFDVLPEKLKKPAALFQIRRDHGLDELSQKRYWTHFKLPQEIIDEIVVSTIQTIMLEAYDCNLSLNEIQRLKRLSANHFKLQHRAQNPNSSNLSPPIAEATSGQQANTALSTSSDVSYPSLSQ